MKEKKIAGVALLLSAVMFGAFISGCINQGSNTGTLTSQTESATRAKTETPTQTETPSGTQTLTQTKTPLKDIPQEKALLELIGSYEKGINDAKVRLKMTGFEVTDGEFSYWDKSAKQLKEMASNERDLTKKIDILRELAELRYYQLLNLRAIAGIGAVEKTYWENATTGKPIEMFYNVRGDFFYTENGKTVRMDARTMAKQMHSLTKGYVLESIEMYHPGTGSVMRAIREGGRTVGASQIAGVIGAKKGAWIRALGEGKPGAIKLIDPNTEETVAKVLPDENGYYQIPPVNTTLLGKVEDEGFCYRPLPLDSNTMTLLPEEPDPPLVCPAPNVAPFVFEPTDTGPYDPAPMDGLYLMPGEYTVQTFVMKADLKQLAEQLVNINVRMGGTKIETRRAKKALDAFQSAVTSVEASMETPAEACSCTFSPFLNGIFKETFGGPFEEVPAIKDINMTDFGNGPFIPKMWANMENNMATITVYVITNSNGKMVILVDDSGTNRLKADYLDRVYVEIITGRNPQTGKELKIVAFKILNTDGTIAVRETLPIKASNVRFIILPSGKEGKLSNTEQTNRR